MGITYEGVTNPGWAFPDTKTCYLTASAQYSRDEILNTGSVIVDFNFTMLFEAAKYKGKLLPNHYNELGNNFAFEYDHP